jgi:hypothetical protein
MAHAVLRSGRMRLRGTTPNRQGFMAAPVRIWRVGGQATYRGEHLGAPAPLARQTGLGDFWMPQRGLFFVGTARFAPTTAQFTGAEHATGATMGR